MKPVVFLSHSKKDKDFIEQVANDLRIARINVWYDEWEIPPGESFRQSMSKGIEECDLFLVYLTANSVDSYWVKYELDAAFVRDSNERHSVIILFVDSNETRTMLKPDLRALHCPTFNNEEYLRPFVQLVAKAWESGARSEIAKMEQVGKMRVLELENRNKDLQLELAKLKVSGARSAEEFTAYLEKKQYHINEEVISLKQIFQIFMYALASGTTWAHLNHLFGKWAGFETRSVEGTILSSFLGPLIARGLIHIKMGEGEYSDEYYLTDLGREVCILIDEVSV